jgi:hypothetical protein
MVTEVKFTKPDGSVFLHSFTTPSNHEAIKMLYPTKEKPLAEEKDFALAAFDDKFTSHAKEALTLNIHQTMEKCSFSDEEKNCWETFLSAIPSHVASINAPPMLLPSPQTGEYRRHNSNKPVTIDNGLRPAYTWSFVFAQVIGDVSEINTRDPETELELQIYRPATFTKLDSKFIHWIGDTNKPWKGTLLRGHVKAIVDRQVQGKKLTAKSQKLIAKLFNL